MSILFILSCWRLKGGMCRANDYTAETGQPQRELPGRKSDWPHLHLGLILTGPSFFDQFPELRILLQRLILPHGQV